MKVLGIKAAISALALAALFVSPAFAAKRHQVNQDHAAAATYSGNVIGGYDSEGNVVNVPNPDRY